MPHFDIVILGSGLVGNSMLCALESLPLRIAVLNKDNPTAIPARQDVRPMSLNYSSSKILQHWDCLPEAVEIKTLLVSESTCFGSIQCQAEDMGLPYLGKVVSYDQLLARLQEKAAHCTAEYFSISDVSSIEQHSASRIIRYKDDTGLESRLSCSLLIVAAGSNELCSQLLATEYTVVSSEYYAAAFAVTTSGSHQQGTYQWSATDAMLAVLPLFSENRSRVVITAAKEAIVKLCEDPSQAKELIESVIASRMGDVESLTSLGSHALTCRIAKEQVLDQAVLMGNAAHSLYPTTAQGFNLSLREVACLAELIADALTSGKDIVPSALLADYWRWVSPLQKQVIGLTQDSHALFSIRGSAFSIVRGLSLSAVDALPSLKKKVFSPLLGLSGRLPKIVLEK